MQPFFPPPNLFENIILLSLFSGAGALTQCWFLLHFCNIADRAKYYAAYLILSGILYLFSLMTPFYLSPMADTLIGAGILFLFAIFVLKQNYKLSAIVSALTMAATTLVESIVYLLEYFILHYSDVPQVYSPVFGELLFLMTRLAIYLFFVKRYHINSKYQSGYLLAFSVPIFFISVVPRTVNAVRYSVSTEGVILRSDMIQTYEIVILTISAFLCICILLFAYEKIIHQVESDHLKTLLQTQIATQENYVAEAKQKYEATLAFRHDFKNHLIALRGFIHDGDLAKASAYMERFEQTYQNITFSLQTGNSVMDTLLKEKLSFARQIGIHIKYDITIPPNVRIDDFDLCAIFANALDNAIKACKVSANGKNTIDIVAKPSRNFFVIDMMNPYQADTFPVGSGIGLATIKTIVQKYHGAVEISDGNNLFRISILLPFDSE